MNGRRFVVTGGASGIGLAVAEQLVERGAELCLVGRRASALEAAVAQLGAAAWAHPADVADPVQVDELVATVGARWPVVDGLVNNAGVATMARLADTSLAAWDETFAVNVRGPFLLLRGLLPRLQAAPGAAVVCVSSTLAEKAIPGMAAYNASKAALNQLVRSAALELAPGIRVNGVMPAVVDTPIHARRGLSSEQVHGMAGLHPLGRVGRPADVAAAVVFLLSDQAAWITGAMIPVDGGMLAT